MATSSSFDIEVIVSDQGLVAQTTVAKVLISILDENDNKPVFSQDTYQKTISEGANLGAEVINVIAKDSDDGANGEIVFKLLNNENTFVIDETKDNRSSIPIG